jgi:hypothetical protein
MRIFFNKILIFCLIFILVNLMVSLLENHFLYKKSYFKLPANTKFIFLGNSRPECAYNDSLIGNSINLSQSAETYFYTYFKTKKVLENNMSVKAIFIEYSDTQISKEADIGIWQDDHLLFFLPKYIPFMNIEDISILITNNPIGFINSYFKSILINILGLVKNDNIVKDKKLGGYYYLIRNKTDSLLNEKSNLNFSKSGNSQLSDINLRYLEKIIELCKKKNIKVYLTTSPYHSSISALFYRPNLRKYIHNKYSNIDFLDYSFTSLSNQEFGDLTHLNHYGALKYSLLFQKNLMKIDSVLNLGTQYQ